MGSTSVTMAPGDVVAGRYRLEALVGQGGFGVVYRATQVSIGRTVALKMLLQGALAHAEGRARFRREAELAQRLTHPNTVRLYDFGETDEGLPFIAWEFLKGMPLDAVLAAEGRLAVPRVARIAAQTLKALMEAHALGIVHRDIKPSNVFLCDFSGERDFVKVLDFGIAKSTLTLGTGLTPEGSVLGTPAYMSPEQVQGLSVSPQSDLYALGLVISEMLDGSVVYAGGVALEVIMAQLSDRPAPLSAEVLASPLGPLVARATEKSLASRFASAAEMLEHLEAAVDPSLHAGGGATTTVRGPTGGPSAPSLTVADTAMAAALAPTGYAPVPSPPAAPPVVADATSASPVAVPVSPARAAIPPTLAVEALPAAVPAPLPAFAPPPAPAPVSGERGWRRLAIAAVAGVIVIGAALAAVLLRDAPVRPGLARPPPTPPSMAGRRFAGFTNKQIRERIEKTGNKVISVDERDPTTTLTLGPPHGRFVQMVRMGEVKAAELLEQAFAKDAGATLRDGNVVLHVHGAPAEARQLLEQITR